MTNRIVTLAAAAAAALVVVLPAEAKTPPPSVVANVGIQVAKLGLAAGAVDHADSTCKTNACLSKSYSAFYAEAHTLDGALQALWTAAGRSGTCATAAVNLGAGFDSLTADYRHLQAAVEKNDAAAATNAYGQIKAKTPRLTAILSSLETRCK